MLSEGERQRVLEQVPPHPLISIYADESGKNADNLIWGSVLFLHACDTLRLTIIVADWRAARRFTEDFILKIWIVIELPPAYIDALRVILSNMPAISFKAITHPRRGIGRPDEALETMLYFLIRRGVEHENETGRAPLPRTVQLWKDLEEESGDQLFLARLHENLSQAAVTLFDRRLRVDEFFALSSRSQILIQLADLFAGSLNRVLNNPAVGPKDDFAQFFLEAVDMPNGPVSAEQAEDIAVQLQL
jgi:hypothetical protein